MHTENTTSLLIEKGIQYHRTSQWDNAIQCYEQALSIEPKNCQVLLLHASLLFQLGDIEGALRSNTKLLALEPHNAGAHNLSGLIYVHKKNYKEAESCFKLAIKNAPGHYHPHASLAEVYKSQGNLKLALEEYLRCTLIDPQNAQGFYQCGLLYLSNGDIAHAIESFNRAITIKPDFVTAYEQLAKACFSNKDFQQAISCYQKLLSHSSSKANVLNNMAIIYQADKKLEKARECYSESLRKQPDNTNIYLNLASLDLMENKLDDANSNLLQSIQLAPDNPVAYNNLGNVLQRLRQPTNAIEAYKKALELRPDYTDAHLNLAYAYLRQGDYLHGWKEHEWRLKLGTAAYQLTCTTLDKNLPLNGKHVLVKTEQGFGDTIQFIRFLPQLKEKGCRITLVTKPEISLLLSQCDGVNQIVAANESNHSPAEYDAGLSLMSLPYILDTSLENLPEQSPYIQASPEKLFRWKNYFDNTAIHVGIVWAGNPEQANDHDRSTSLSHFLHLDKIPGVRIYSLQYGDARRQLEQLDPHHNITDLGYAWDDTAAIIQHLDLVISVDTSVAHLAGAMAIPTWVLLSDYSDWRWMTDRHDSPWYPTMTLIRQNKHNDWKELFERVREKLERFAADKNDKR